jgi:hypothetical protein
VLVQSKRNKHAAPTFSEVRPRSDCGVNMTLIGSLVWVDLVEVAARVDPFFALWGAPAAASRGVLIAAARRRTVNVGQVSHHLAQDGEEASMRLAP